MNPQELEAMNISYLKYKYGFIDRDTLFKESFNKYLQEKELNNKGDILLDNDYQELKQSDNKDFYKEAIS